MSNRFAGNVIVVDTTDTQLGGQDKGIGPEKLAIRLIQWISTAASPITNDADLTIKVGTTTGVIIIAPRAAVHETAGNQDLGNVVFYEAKFEGDHPWMPSRLFVEDIDSGELVIFLA